MARKKSETPPPPAPASRQKMPLEDTRTMRINKPQITANREAVRQAAREEAAVPPSFWGLMVRFVPLWLLIIAIIIFDPLLPIHLIGGLTNWIRGLGQEAPIVLRPPASEPIYIVQNAEVPVDEQLPPPDWPMEISAHYTPEVQFWKDAIASWSLTYRVRPNMIATIMQIESCGNPDAVSPVGAAGLFQVMPFHFQEGEDPLDPNYSAMRGLLFFGELLARTNGDTALAFAAYNGGASVIDLSPSEWAQETRDYQFWASGIYEEAEQGLAESPTLIEWLNAGGASLCASASATLGLNLQQQLTPQE